MSEKADKQYFIHNNTKIIISEHFAKNGKSLTDIIKEAICREAPNYRKEIIPINS